MTETTAQHEVQQEIGDAALAAHHAGVLVTRWHSTTIEVDSQTFRPAVAQQSNPRYLLTVANRRTEPHALTTHWGRNVGPAPHSLHEDVMTTTVIRPVRAVLAHDKVVLSERFKVEPLCEAGPPRDDDMRLVGAMRRVAAAQLRECGMSALADEAALIVSELLTNALVHSGTSEVCLHLAVREGFLIITVVDGMPGAVQLKQAGDDAESGRGLELVAAVAEACDGAWGTSDGGAETWCCLAFPAAEEQR